MSYLPIPLHCATCGDTPSRIEEVGLSGDRELVVHWWCAQCHRVVNAAISLTNCWQMCPAADADPKAVARADARFLASLGIRY